MSYVIIQKRHFYGPKDREELHTTIFGVAAAFASAETAKAHIETLEAARYDLAHGEYDRPDYRVARASRLPKRLKVQLDDIGWEFIEVAPANSFPLFGRTYRQHAA
ncbi:hypothetical protein [Brucella intermedia]|uniref:hypothetical protein n=1 Tax=Brucella intermedia TaxID=94625 RepID=UPI000EFB00BF|nr:hypothetical protein [Brucella intermedia]KAB2720383.1 hypothetical protein F9K75_04745 [Brucella intermedia]